MARRIRPTHARLTPLFALLIGLTACGGEDATSANGGDGPADAGVTDAGATDAGATDTGATDTGATDAGATADGDATAVVKDAAADAANGCSPAKCAAKGVALAACHEWTCDSAGTCKDSVTPDSVSCDDGDDCTTSETCSAGTCQGGTNLCPCAPGSVASCWGALGLSEKDLCAGTPVCEAYTEGQKHLRRCALNPATVVTCPATNDSTCSKNTCAPADGKCHMAAVKPGTPCDDGIQCTKGDVCSDGKCVVGIDTCWCTPEKGVAKCYGGAPGQVNVNPSDKCQAAVVCVPTTDSVTQQVDYSCKLAAAAVTCSAAHDTVCLKNSCDPTQGICTLKDPNAGKTKLCDDGDPCTANDVCKAGACVGGVKICSCQKDSDCAGKEDGNQCNGTLACDKSTGTCVDKPGSKIDCPDTGAGVCITDYCDPKTGACKVGPSEQFKTQTLLKEVYDGPGFVKLVVVGTYTVFVGVKSQYVGCTDGDACTAGDECEGGSCKPGTQSICACAKDADCANVDDGDVCTGTLMCTKGACVANPATVPPPCKGPVAGTCLTSVCNAKSGQCETKANTVGCDDGNPCTADSCGSDDKTCAHAPTAKGTPCFGQVCNGAGACVVKAP